MFNGCTSLTDDKLHIPKNFPNVTDLSYMYHNCTGLKQSPLEGRFPNCTSAKDFISGTPLEGELNIQLPMVKYGATIFSGQKKVTRIITDLTSFKSYTNVETTSSYGTSMNSMFQNDSLVEYIDLTECTPLFGHYMFGGCTKLQTIVGLSLSGLTLDVFNEYPRIST